MIRPQDRIFKTQSSGTKSFTPADALALLAVIALVSIGAWIALNSPASIEGPNISLSPSVLPIYALFSVTRMAAAYLLSLVFTLLYGRTAAYHRRAEKILIPLLDILQSIPILSFLPVVLLSLNAILPEGIASELAAVVLIFTSQAWNMTFAWYQSLTTIPKELREASTIFRLNTWMQFRSLELPFGMISLIWNSMMSWAGGWFFLMAAEIFTVGERDFRLPGLGAYLHEAANQGNLSAIGWGLGVLVLIIVLLDQFVWRPLLAWSDRFKVEMIENDNPPQSWFYEWLHSSWFYIQVSQHILQPLRERIDTRLQTQPLPVADSSSEEKKPSFLASLPRLILIGVIAYGAFRAVQLLEMVSLADWLDMGLGVLATSLRVLIALFLALLWTVPVGVAIGTNPRLAAVLQPVVQIAASVPATALFPMLLLFMLTLPGGLNIAAVGLMLMGTQWYLLFNVIAGASAIPQDLKYSAKLMGLNGWTRWTTLILPSLFPYLITGAITASGGAWNASIVAEYVQFSGNTYAAKGIGATIATATATGNYPLLLAATLFMVLVVVLLNRFIWRPLYQIAEDQYRME